MDGVLTILLVILPELRTLHMNGIFHVDPHLSDLLNYMNQNIGKTLILQHLSAIELLHGNTSPEFTPSMKELSLFTPLPRLRHLKVTRLGRFIG